MPKPPNIIRPTRLEISIPQDLRGRLDLHLWSDTEMRVPHSAYSRLIERLLRQYLEEVSDASIS